MRVVGEEDERDDARGRRHHDDPLEAVVELERALGAEDVDVEREDGEEVVDLDDRVGPLGAHVGEDREDLEVVDADREDREAHLLLVEDVADAREHDDGGERERDEQDRVVRARRALAVLARGRASARPWRCSSRGCPSARRRSTTSSGRPCSRACTCCRRGTPRRRVARREIPARRAVLAAGHAVLAGAGAGTLRETTMAVDVPGAGQGEPPVVGLGDGLDAVQRALGLAVVARRADRARRGKTRLRA